MMRTIRMVIELTYDEELWHSGDSDEKQWFHNSVLKNMTEEDGLLLHSNLVGDVVGAVKVLEIEDQT